MSKALKCFWSTRPRLPILPVSGSFSLPTHQYCCSLMSLSRGNNIQLPVWCSSSCLPRNVTVTALSEYLVHVCDTLSSPGYTTLEAETGERPSGEGGSSGPCSYIAIVWYACLNISLQRQVNSNDLF